MQFITFLDDAGADFMPARANCEKILAASSGQLVRLLPEHIHPLEVIDPKSSARVIKGSGTHYLAVDGRSAPGIEQVLPAHHDDLVEPIAHMARLLSDDKAFERDPV